MHEVSVPVIRFDIPSPLRVSTAESLAVVALRLEKVFGALGTKYDPEADFGAVSVSPADFDFLLQCLSREWDEPAEAAVDLASLTAAVFESGDVAVVSRHFVYGGDRRDIREGLAVLSASHITYEHVGREEYDEAVAKFGPRFA